nr:topoisomerase 2 [Cucujiformia]
DAKMDCIKVEINRETNTISVYNNGKGLPVTMHAEEKMYVPTMVFGHLLTSSNYNDEEEKVTGGRNGFGAKLCNIYSTKFIVETASIEFKKQFKQTWGANMTKVSDPKIKEFSGDDYTKITFCPDLERFKMKELDDGIIGLLSRRAYDVAASARGVKVFLNGKRIPVTTFNKYIELFLKNTDPDDELRSSRKIVYENCSERWEVAVTVSDREEFQQMSFVNSIATTKGGRHVEHVTDLIAKKLVTIVNKKNKGGIPIKLHQVKAHMWVFINCLIVNPAFDSQTKENMTSQMKNFGSKCVLSDKFFTAVTKCGIVDAILDSARSKEQKLLNKDDGKKVKCVKGIPNLVDANKAGSPLSLNCTLILTEGDSAKSLVMSGFGVIGREFYGVYPLRGKMLNVRDAPSTQISQNKEITEIIKAVGLKKGNKYQSKEDLSTLRYGKIMIMT